MREKLRKQRSIILFIVIVLAFNTITYAQSYIAQPIGRIDTDGTSVVWSSFVNGEWGVYYANLSTNIQKKIISGESAPSYPSIWDNKIAWQEYIDDKFEIILYDMVSEASQKISTLAGNNIEPLIRGNYIIWANQNNGYKNIVIYNMLTKNQEIVTSNILVNGVDFDGEYVVWMDGRNGNLDIYAYDIENKKEIRVTSDMQDDTDPVVSNGEVIYTTTYGGTTHLHKYNFIKEEDTKLTAGDEEHKLLDFSNGQMIMTEGEEVKIKDTETTLETEIKNVNNEVPKGAFISGDKIVWVNDSGIDNDTIDLAKNRVKEPPANQSPKEESNNNSTPSTGKDKENKGKKIEVEKGKLEVILDITDESQNISLEEKKLDIPDGYSLASKIYEINMEDDTENKNVTLLIHYNNYEAGDKLRIYSIEDKPKALKFKRNKKYGTISVEVENGMTIALMTMDKDYKDLKSHWAKETIEKVASQQMISGYKDGTIRPNSTITRAEFMKILVNYFASDENPQGEGFTDTKGHWAENDLKIAKNKGWIQGYDGKAAPNSEITREEMVTILMRLSEETISNTETNLNDFSDYSNVSNWSKDSIEKAIKEGILQGHNNKIKPKSNATRAEAISIIYRFLDNRGNI